MALSKRAKQFQQLLDDQGLGLEVKELPDSTRSADDAAAALGCTKAQIVKSLVFRDSNTDRPVVVLASGVNRVSESEVAKATGVHLGKADAQFVKEKTGFTIGGVPPLGHKEQAVVLVDRDLLQYEEVWAAAGTPNAVFKINGPITGILSEHIVVAVC